MYIRAVGKRYKVECRVTDPSGSVLSSKCGFATLFDPPWGAAGFGRPRGAQLERDLRHQGRCAGAWHGTAKDKEFKARVAGGFMPCSVRE